MKMKPLVYIILPVYNWEKYLLQQLMSIYYQDYKDWHLVIVNDWSTDTTKWIIEKYIEDYKLEAKTTVINQANSWVNKAIESWLIKVQELVNESWNTNAYVTYCDADDILMMNKLSYQVNFMENNENCDLSYHDLVIINEYNEIIDKSYFKVLDKNIITNTKCNKFHELAFSNHIPSNTPMFRVNHIWELLPIPSPFPFHDRWTWLVFSYNSYNILRIDNALWCYRKCTTWASESWKKYNKDKLYEQFAISLEGLKNNVKNETNANVINTYIKFYRETSKILKKHKWVLIQIINILIKHPKILIYKIQSYLIW